MMEEFSIDMNSAEFEIYNKNFWKKLENKEIVLTAQTKLKKSRLNIVLVFSFETVFKKLVCLLNHLIKPDLFSNKAMRRILENSQS